MLRVSYVNVILIVLFVLSTPFSSIKAAEQQEVSTAPTTNNGRKWRIGYIEGGPWRDYQSSLKAFIHHLAELGWIEKTPFPQTQDEQEIRTIWTWLAGDVQSDYLEFVADAYWSAGWDENLRGKNRENVITRLNKKEDIDLMLALGTWAGLDMANNRHSVPTMVLSTSDPIRAGIIKSVEDSGYDHLHARVDPTRFERQFRLFHNIVGFKKLGIVFEDTPAGRSYAAIEDVKKVADESGFEVLECFGPGDTTDINKAEKALLECHQKLAPHIDAFYLTLPSGITSKNLPKLLAPFFEYKVPTFAQGRTGEVKYGALMSMARENFLHVGRFYTETFARILNGAKPRDLPQVFESPPAIAINLETARRIGFHFPLDILAGAQEVYEHIERIE